MTSGSPPTARNARTGLLTPPTSTCSAWRKISCERVRARFPAPAPVACVTLRPRRLACSEPARGVFGVVGEDDVRAGALNRREDFQNHALLVHPAIAGGG